MIPSSGKRTLALVEGFSSHSYICKLGGRNNPYPYIQSQNVLSVQKGDKKKKRKLDFSDEVIFVYKVKEVVRICLMDE